MRDGGREIASEREEGDERREMDTTTKEKRRAYKESKGRTERRAMRGQR